MATYTRQSTFTDGDTIFAALLNNEYDQLVAAFNVSTGHTHYGTTTGDGGPISKLFSNAITFGTNANSDVVVTFDATSNDGVLSWMEDEDYFQFSDDILLSTDEKLLFRDSAIYINSSVDGQLDLVADTEIQIAATTIDINGNTEISGSLTLGSSTAVSSVLDEDNMASDSATALATQQSIKAYVDAVTTSLNQQDLDFQGDSGGALDIDLDTETLTIAGGTGIDTVGSGTTLTVSIDTATVATLTDSQILTNKVIDVDNNTVSNIEVDNLKSGVVDTDLTSVSASDDTLASAKSIKTYVDAQDANIASDTLIFTNKTIDANGTGNSITNLEVADFASGVVDTALASVSASDDTLASAKAIKSYVDTQVATVPTGDITEVVAGTGLSGGATSGSATLTIDTGTTADLTTSQVLSNKTLTSPVINTGVSGSAILDEDNFASDSDTKLATQQSIKAYVASQVATANELSELTDTNITSAADGALLFYDTATSKWIDNVVSGDITIADTGVATIAAGAVDNAMLAGSITNDKLVNSTVSYGGISLALGASDSTPAFDLTDATNYPTSSLTGTITNAQLAGSIEVSKTLLAAGTGLTLTTDTLSVDASQTQITSVGTLGSLTVSGDLTIDTSTLKVDSTNNRVGILNATPDVTLDIGSATDAIHMPVGTTAQRPTGAAGYFRYNTDLGQFEGYTDEWGSIAGSGGASAVEQQIFAGTGSQTDFTLTTAPATENNLLVFIDGVFQAQDSYSVSGTTLTFSTAPVSGRVITVYHVRSSVSGANMIVDSMTGDGSDTTLTLSVAPVSVNNIQVYFDGVYQAKSNYSVSGTTLTFTTAPPSGVAVEAITHTQTSVNEPAANTVTPAKIAAGDFYFDTDTLYIDSTNNRVGIGTSSPATGIDVQTTNYTYSGTTYDIYGIVGLTG